MRDVRRGGRKSWANDGVRQPYLTKICPTTQSRNTISRWINYSNSRESVVPEFHNFKGLDILVFVNHLLAAGEQFHTAEDLKPTVADYLNSQNMVSGG